MGHTRMVRARKPPAIFDPAVDGANDMTRQGKVSKSKGIKKGKKKPAKKSQQRRSQRRQRRRRQRRRSHQPRRQQRRRRRRRSNLVLSTGGTVVGVHAWPSFERTVSKIQGVTMYTIIKRINDE